MQVSSPAAYEWLRRVSLYFGIKDDGINLRYDSTIHQNLANDDYFVFYSFVRIGLM
jgi:hypothetical protein